MNALTTQLASPSGAAAMIPRSMRDAMEMANMMAKTGFLPREIQSPGGALFVMEQAMRWNMSPFAVATEVSFIQGKPMFSGKIVAAAVQSSGCLDGRLSYDYTGQGESRTITVRGTLRGEVEPREVSVRLGDAKTNNKVWQTQPDQQLAYHGARVWARRHAPEVMLGVYAPEEFEEAPAAPPRSVQSTVVEQRPAAAGSMREFAQNIPPKAAADRLPILTQNMDLISRAPGQWLADVKTILDSLESVEAVFAWRDAMGPHCEVIAERGHGDLLSDGKAAIEARLLALADASFPGDGAPA